MENIGILIIEDQEDMAGVWDWKPSGNMPALWGDPGAGLVD